MKLLQQWTTELLKINGSALCEPKLYKLRSDLYEVVAKCYLDDCNDDYIGNAQKIFGMVVETNLNNTQETMLTNLIRFFRDLAGVCRSVTTANIFRTLSKIIYPTVQNL